MRIVLLSAVTTAALFTFIHLIYLFMCHECQSMSAEETKIYY